jgi:predicted transcriptional regulator
MVKAKNDGIQELVDEILAKNKIIEELKEEVDLLKEYNNDIDEELADAYEENKVLWNLIAKLKGFKNGE